MPDRQKKSLGQHWLFDEATLMRVVAAGEIDKDDTVLEIGPGLGTLTQYICVLAKRVVAVEADEQLAGALKTRVPANNLTVINGDILGFDFDNLPKGYKVVANIPYYITSHLLRKLWDGANPPVLASLLIQKEVAERVAAEPGDMSVLAISVQYYAETKVVATIPKELFEPIPKVDSAILQIRTRHQPYFPADTKKLFRLVKAGFSERRKKLVNSLAGGLQFNKDQIAKLLDKASLDPDARAQELSLDNWQELYEAIKTKNHNIN